MKVKVVAAFFLLPVVSLLSLVVAGELCSHRYSSRWLPHSVALVGLLAELVLGMAMMLFSMALAAMVAVVLSFSGPGEEEKETATPVASVETIASEATAQEVTSSTL